MRIGGAAVAIWSLCTLTLGGPQPSTPTAAAQGGPAPQGALQRDAEPRRALSSSARSPSARLRMADSTRCAVCHPFPERLSHPLDVSAPLGTGLPLDSDGRVGCLTCHDERSGTLDHARASRRERGALLRLDAPALCRSCHATDGAGIASRVAHALGDGRAHLTGGPLAGDGELLDGIDSSSRACLGCHDGAIASAPRVSEGRSPGSVGRTAPSSSHPIGIDYRPQNARRRGTRLRPVSELPPEILLPDGKVGCASCHSYYSRARDMLTVDISKSRLCLACHAM